MVNLDIREVKQVIVVRKDLNMRKGKIAAQVAHASLSALLSRMKVTNDDEYLIISGVYLDTSPIAKWLEKSFTKVVVYVESEQELKTVYEAAKKRNVPCSYITDEGRTEFKGVPTATCTAIGPYWGDVINELTGDMKLL